jgi:hypothetical protein
LTRRVTHFSRLLPEVGILTFGVSTLTVLVKTTTTEDAPLSAIFGGRGFRPLKPYDFVAAFDFVVQRRRLDPHRLREISPEFNQPQRMQQKSPAFEPREDRGSLSQYGVGKNEEGQASP